MWLLGHLIELVEPVVDYGEEPGGALQGVRAARLWGVSWSVIAPVIAPHYPVIAPVIATYYPVIATHYPVIAPHYQIMHRVSVDFMGGQCTAITIGPKHCTATNYK